MSTDAISLVKSRYVGSPTVKAILFVLADYADAEWSTFVGQKRLAAEVETTDRTIRNALSDLEDRGLIRRERRHRQDGSRTSDRIHLVRNAIENLPEADSARTPAYRKDVPDLPEPVSAHEPPVEPREPKGSRDDTDRIGVWTALEDLFGEPAETDRKLRGKVLRSLLKAGATHSEVHRRAKAWPTLFPPSNGGRPPTLTVTALEKHWGQLGKVSEDAKPFNPDECDHPDGMRALVDDAEFCGVCRRELHAV